MGIHVENVHFSYGDREVLHGITLDVPSGRFVGLIGPNGSGKSTLMKLVYRVLKTDEGTIEIDGKPISEMSYRKSAQLVAVMSQSNSLEFDFTVRDMVMMGRSPYKRRFERENKEDVRIVQETLELVNLSSYANRNMHELSGGEQQRVIFARALAQRTAYMIMDEPTNQFDITYQLELMRIAKRTCPTVLASFHDLNIAASFCDYLYCIVDGSIIAQGTPEEVLTCENIDDVYHVGCEVRHDCDGNLHILYRSGLGKRVPDDEGGDMMGVG